jgi:hypothetical protein
MLYAAAFFFRVCAVSVRGCAPGPGVPMAEEKNSEPAAVRPRTVYEGPRGAGGS